MGLVKAAHMDKPQTWRGYRQDLDNVLSFLDECGVRQVSQLTPAFLEDFETVRLTEPREVTYWHYGKELTRTVPPVGQRTVNKVVGALKAAVTWAVDRGMVVANPIGRVKRKPVKRKRKVRRALTVNERRELLSASPEPFRSMWALALGTGLRRRELVELQWSDIGLERGQLTVRAEIAKNSEVETFEGEIEPSHVGPADVRCSQAKA
jgi:integrase